MKNQIDHVMIDPRRKRYILDVKSCRGVRGILDHILVRIKMHIRLSVDWRTKETTTKKFNIVKLKEQTEKIAYIEGVDKLG